MKSNIIIPQQELARQKRELMQKTKPYYDALAYHMGLKPMRIIVTPTGIFSDTGPDDDYEKSIKETIAYIESLYPDLVNNKKHENE